MEGMKKNGKWIAVAAAGLLLIGGGIGYKMISDYREAAVEAARMERNRESLEKAAQVQEGGMFDDSVESGISVFETVRKRPEAVELTEENAADFITVESCLVDQKTSNISLKFSSQGIPVSDDKYYYLFAIRACYDGIPDDLSPIIRKRKAEEMEFLFSRHFGSISGFLYKYQVAVKVDDKYVPVGSPNYVTNPEGIAFYKSNGDTVSSKKGLLVAPDKVQSSELEDLGVKHAAYNIQMSRILDVEEGDEDGEYPPVAYAYNGKGYLFNGQVMAEYDMVFRTLTEKGIEITAILLNDVTDFPEQAIHPLSRSGIGTAPYYAFNAADEEIGRAHV